MSGFSEELLSKIHDLESYPVEVEVDEDFSYIYNQFFGVMGNKTEG